ncbi:MAG: 50S ribosomal protein L16 [Planctomycetota bacterium]|jgi:large subunit ribosomal protein L16|nr:50S ribosomal protein L16 [Planctomycetota bacterium]MDP6941832.1 50S ribosomal protein L16 [Planctomycetota bacterium]
MLMPKRVKYRKSQRGKIKGTYTSGLAGGKGAGAKKLHRKARPNPIKKPCRAKAMRGNRVAFGDFGLQALEWCWLSARTIEAGRVAAGRAASEAKLWIRVFPHKPVTAKPLEVRMGSGKGDVDRWVAVILPGTIIYELGGVDEEIARTAFNRVSHKLPIRVRMVARKHI